MLEFVGYGFWNPIVWLIAFAVVMLIVYLFRNRGQEGYKKGTDQAKIFLCGEEVPEAEQRHVRGGNVYWGFFETLKGYYSCVTKPHTGIINDYMIWLVVIITLTTLILLVVG